MSDILCRWLNRELRLSKRVEPDTFAKEFATGYLLGEVLDKYQLQDDFDQFSKGRNSESKLNNFSRVEPTLALLGIPFDYNIAEAIMTEQYGVATRLLYQLFIALQKKKKLGLTGIAMETMRPAAPAKLQGIGTEMYKERLKSRVPRQVNLILQNLSAQYEKKTNEMTEKVTLAHYKELKKLQQLQEELRLQDIEKHRQAKKNQNELMARIQLAIVKIPKPPPNRTLKAIEAQKQLWKKKEAEEVNREIFQFEKMLKHLAPFSNKNDVDRNVHASFQPEELCIKSESVTDWIRVQSNDEYIGKIRKRLEEDSFAREQREKRRRKVLLEQLKAHEAQEEAYREEQLINRLMRQSQQERRIAVQLMHVRHEKEVLRQNRIFREKQYEERRLQEFQEALDKEAALAKQERIDSQEQIQKEIEIHEKVAAERAEARYRKHYQICQEILDQIIDLTAKMGEYRELTRNLIPAKLFREWKELFFYGKPLYEQASIDCLPSDPTPEQLVELEKLQLLDEQDYEDYTTMTGEWYPPEDCETKGPAPNNNVLGHVVHRLFDIIYPPEPPAPPPTFPPFPIKACVIGKTFAGKTTSLKYVVQAHRVQLLSADILVQEAVKAFYDNEIIEYEETLTEDQDTGKDNQVSESHHSVSNEVEGASLNTPCTETQNTLKDRKNSGQPESSTFETIKAPSELQATKSNEDVEKDKSPQFTVRAQLGAKVEEFLKQGKNIPDELLVDIMVEAINRVPQESGWIMDGFPVTLNQAKLLEKAITGVDPDKTEAKSKRSKTSLLVIDPTAPKEPPPPPPALDVAIFLDVADILVLKRAIEKIGDSDSSHEHHVDLTLSSEGPIMEPEERDTSSKLTSEQEQVQHRITGFLDTWPKLETWFSEQQKILVTVNAEVDEESLCKKVEVVLLETMTKKWQKEESKESNKEEESLLQVPSAETQIPQPAEVKEAPPVIVESTTIQEKTLPRSPKESQSRPQSDKSKKGKKSETPKEKENPKGSKSRPQSGSGKKKSAKKNMEPVSPEPPPQPVPVEPPPIKPGSEEWVYVDEPLPTEIPEYLVPYWETVVDTYQNTIKAIFRNIRNENILIIHYLWDVRKEYKEYLTCPDHKQEFVSQWQQDYNSVAGDMQEDEETKAEIHQRVDDLRERLWDICDTRKEESEQERCNIINNGWLIDHTGVLINHFSSLMQVEVACFQDTLRLLKDYYKGMEGKIPPEITQDFVRLPLVDILDTEQPADPEKLKKIPLVPRRPQSSELPGSVGIAGGRLKTKLPSVKIKEDHSSESPTLNYDVDEKLIVDSWQASLTAISNMNEMNCKRTPTPQPPPPPVEESPEEIRKRELRFRMYQEYFGALEHEESLAPVKMKAKVIQLDPLLFFSIDRLTGFIRHHIETATKIQYELMLQRSDFYVCGDVKLIPDPIPPPRPPPREIQQNETLTIRQLNVFYQQFMEISPGGYLSSKAFAKVLQDLTTLNLGTDTLPDVWTHLSASQVQELTSLLSLHSEYITWRKFLLLAAQPWPYPSDIQLLQTLQNFKSVDPTETGYVTEEQYDKVDLWFESDIDFPIPDDPTEPLPFNRLEHIRKYFFTLFADHQRNPSQLDYTDMLLFFASHLDPNEGFYRALSIVSGIQIPRKNAVSDLLKSVPSIDQSTADEIETTVEPKYQPVAGKGSVPLAGLLRMINHGRNKVEDNHRYSVQQEAKDISNERFIQLFRELGSEKLEPIPFAVLLEHPLMLELMENNYQFKLPDIQVILQQVKQTLQLEGEAQSSSTV
nr:PREDICTED: sperm flagellar protein 2 [Latimeria chalumnae]|eukprot:XP_014353121.1 PREDICTED: sperm flagellar protein 2 [Latimeria chalumnae]